MRRSLLSLLMAVSLASAAAAQGLSPLKIGVLTDMSGPYSAIAGKGSVAAARLAVVDFGGTVLGRPIELLVADHGSKPDTAVGITRQWYDVDQVSGVFDGAGSAVALAVLNLAKERNRIMAFAGVISSDVTGKLCGETISSWAWDTHAMVATSMESLMKQRGNKVFFLTLDNAIGQAFERDATRIIMRAGGEVIGSVRHPFNNADFSSYLLQAQAARPKVLVLANAGADTVNSVKQAHEFGLASNMTVAGLLATINDVDALGLEVAQGLMVSESFYWDMTDATRAWNVRFMALTEAPANMLQAAVYSSVLHYLKAVERAGTDDGKAVAAAMKALPINDFYSKDVLLRADGRAVRDFYLFQVKLPTESKQRWDDYKFVNRLPGAEAFPADGSECPLLRP